MKTYQEFRKEIENSRGHRPGQKEYNPYDCYLGFIFENGKYTLIGTPENESNPIELPETKVKDRDFTAVANYLCDLLEKYVGIKNELNFSDNFPENEKKFIQRLERIAYKFRR